MNTESEHADGRASERASPPRERALVIGAWSAFALGVFLLALLSLNACNLSFLRGLFGGICEVDTTFAAGAPASPLIDEIRLLERQLAQAPACERPQEQAEAAPPLACPEPPPEEVVLSIDLSGSMEFCTGTSVAKERELEALGREMGQPMFPWQYAVLERRYNALASSLECAPPTRRIDFAKRALTDLARSSRSSTAFVMQSFNACNTSPVTHGRYAGNERERMIGQISAMQTAPNTNLAAAIRAAAGQLRGGRTAEEPANIVIVSDGNDNCGGDPCEAARSVKANYPFTKIHVISVGGDVAVGKCIAAATGGQVFDARDAAKLADAIAAASGENLPEACRKP